jgi:signal transduction histidine kinase
MWGWVGAWSYALPVIAIFLSQFYGIVLSAIVLILETSIMYVPGLLQTELHPDIKIRLVSVYALIYLVGIMYEQIRKLKDMKEKELLLNLQYEKDTIQIMKDSLKQGLFLMDRDYKIQPQYSSQLNSILHRSESLTGKDFVDILGSSVSNENGTTLRKYFNMIFSKSHKASILESANPISELELKVDNEIKILDCKFTLVDKENPYILGIIQDITKEKKLQSMLDNQEKDKQKEINTLYNVMQIDPVVFEDFIEDTDYEFKRINDALKSQQSPLEILRTFFNSVHAIKSNAAILGLSDFAEHLHSLEDEIRKRQLQDATNFGDFLFLTTALETLMQEKDSFSKIVSKINAFKSNSTPESILQTILTKTTQKVAQDLEKNITLDINIQPNILNRLSRRNVKEILIQCIRNSCIHGIESYKERGTKSATGIIKIEIKDNGTDALISISDDGKGFDLNKIKQKAISLGLLTDSASKVDIIKQVFKPGFSTLDELNVHGGRGVGMDLVYSLVKELNGKIKVSTVENKGSTIFFNIPFKNRN